MSESQVEQDAANFAAKFEGFRSAPYADTNGVWTIGYGSIRINGVGPARVAMATPAITEPQARTWLAAELKTCAQAVLDTTTVPLTQGQQIAIVDFVYNLGIGNFTSSTLLRKLNAGDYAGAAAEFDKWDHAGGKELAGLLRRRQAETDLFQASMPAQQTADDLNAAELATLSGNPT